jgi:ribosomal protein S18 acetylase RimI-like enzyme
VIELRRLTPDEWRLWRDVRLRALSEAPAAFGSTLAQWQGEDHDLEVRWRARLEEVPFNVVAVAEEGGPAVGQVSGVGPDDERRVELISMWVDPAARGTGVGEALIDAVLRWAREQEAPTVVLSVKERNEPAIRLYRRMGFVRTEEAADDGEIRMQAD